MAPPSEAVGFVWQVANALGSPRRLPPRWAARERRGRQTDPPAWLSFNLLQRDRSEHGHRTQSPRRALDAGLVASAQAVEHQARYGTLKSWAQQLGPSSAVALPDATQREETKTDELLTKTSSSKAV